MGSGRAMETLVGVGVVIVAVIFLYYAYQASGRASTIGAYRLNAVFGRVDGVTVGSEVRVAGVKVGAVTAAGLDPKSYEARLEMAIAGDVGVPEDSIAKIASSGLLGASHVAIEPGASDVMLKDGETIGFTQGSVDLLGLAVEAFTERGPAPAPEEAEAAGELQ